MLTVLVFLAILGLVLGRLQLAISSRAAEAGLVEGGWLLGRFSVNDHH